uniref:Uncharacterized protein n=1 Tax=Caenorhabditis japonica TaxID=281687 RepID=A0A8R1IUQ0_CAEJA
MERVEIDQLPDILIDAKKKIDKWPELERKLKKDIEATEGFHRILNFPFAQETVFQLACSQQVLSIPRYCCKRTING